jgi:NAD(P)-dependent dehydrogenase (short-subunit alcohol dehydrogenase family)
MLLEGKVVVVVGVGPGLGRSIAIAAANEGADVVVAARSEESLRAVTRGISELGRRTLAVKVDVTSFEDCERLAHEVVGELGGIDVLVHNAFFDGPAAKFEDADLSIWRRAVEVNAFGGLHLVRACLDPLKERKGSIVLINSRQIRRLGHPRGGYAMSKAALFIAGQVLATELGPYGIRVNSVVPGWMWGPSVEGYFESQVENGAGTVEEQYTEVVKDFALHKMPTPDDVADAVIFLASSRAGAITGQSLDVNAGESFN